MPPLQFRSSADPRGKLGRARPPSLSPVHVFAFRGRQFGFFVRTGDLVELSEAAADALAQIERGLPPDEIHASLAERFDPDRAEEVQRDLQVLEDAGLLTPEVELTDRERQLDHERLLRHQPRNLMFFVTEKCNLQCTYCYEKNQGVHERGRNLRQVDARRIIDRYFEQSAGRSGLTITFFGGEPLLNPAVIRDTVAYAKEKAALAGQVVGFTMTTNLTLLTESMADFLAAEKFHVMVSLDGDRETNDAHRVFRGGRGSYDVVVRNLKMLIGKMKAAGVRLPKIRATMTSGNIDPLATEAHLRSLGTPLVEMGESHGTVIHKEPYDVGADEAAEQKMTRSIADHVDGILAQLEADPTALPEVVPSIVKTLRRIHGEVSREEAHQAARPTLCGVCRNMKAVTPSGDLYPCHRYVGMSAFKFGNMHDGGLDQGRVLDYYDRLYRVYAKKCAPCWLRHLCGGQCPWYLSSEDGSITEPDDATCDKIRAGYERQMGLYATLLRSYPAAFGHYVGVDADEVRGEGEPFADCFVDRGERIEP